jgi:uncharacterized protein YprB with RNaseH-like and TPR domain
VRIENSFIPVDGVGETTERRLWEDGITHWDAFDRGVDGVGDTLAGRIESFIDDAKHRLERNDVSYFAAEFPDSCHWRLYENVRADTCFFDIETTGLDATHNDVTTVSLHRDGETTTYVSGRDLTADRLEAELNDAALLVTFNGKRFDVPFLETCFDIDVTSAHVDLMYLCRRLGYSGGLAAIEREFGIERANPDISGQDAVRLWYEYQNGDESALDTLVEYNRADAANLQTLLDSACRSLHEDLFASAPAAPDPR